jgi:amidase
MKELAFYSATKLVQSIKAGKINSIELLDHFADRVERLNPELNAVIQMDLKNARNRAVKADSAIKNGEDWGPLHGLPVTIKDSLEVVGMPCSSGAPELKNYMPEKNADVVQSLIDAGAIVFGKTNMPLYGGDVQSFNNVYGQSNNPWDRSLTPGGSSGGAAAAVAAGLTGLEIGSDIGGSIRTPAHFCGIYGHKPSFGIVPDRGHIPPPPGIFTGDYTLTADIVVVGPLARSADDISLAMNLIASPEKPEKKAWTIKLPEPRKKELKDFRIAVWLNDPACPVDILVSDRIQTLVDKLAKKGARVNEAHPQINFAENNAMYLDLLAAIMGAGLPREMFESLVHTAPTLSKDDQSHLARHIRGATQLHRNWISQDAVRQIMRQKWDDFFVDYDVLLCPAAPVAAFPHNHEYIYERTIHVNGNKRPYLDMLGWAGITGVAFLPATVAPAGLTPKGHPVGVQIVGPYLEDRTTIHFAKLMEEVVGGFVPPPDYTNR